MTATVIERKRHGKKITSYGFGRTAMFACQFDQRFSYCLYVPRGYDEDGATTYPLAVIVHGSGRNATEYRDAFIDFAEHEQCIVLSPLFPCGIIEPGEVNNYKYITYHDIRFDHVLLAMIDEAAATYRIEADKFLLFGFSGGGHFTHRFFYLHPNRLLGLSVGAPGVVTLLNHDRDYWVGVRDFEAVFGAPLDLDGMRRVPVQLVIGDDDTETWEITISPTSRTWMPGAEDAGVNRQDRMSSLKASLEQHGIDVRQATVPGVGHEGFKVLEPVKSFFSEILGRHRAV
ncbi:MAG: alpha/beta hydrolase [Chloroflexota bacterium]|nr:alpha/beta hydrolase [Chloroflexota bacterium]